MNLISKGLYLIISDNSFWFEMSGELDKVPDVDIDEGVFKYVYIRVYEDDGGDGRCRTQKNNNNQHKYYLRRECTYLRNIQNLGIWNNSAC